MTLPLKLWVVFLFLVLLFSRSNMAEATLSEQAEVVPDEAVAVEAIPSNPAPTMTERVSDPEKSAVAQDHDTSSTPIMIDDEKHEMCPPTDSVTDFVGQVLTPFISALEGFDGIGSSPTSNPPSTEIKDENAEHTTAGTVDATKIEERVMRPIRELIYKSFHEPSEGEEGIEYVISQLSAFKMGSQGCSTDLVVSYLSLCCL